ncbi:MAG: type II secretion system protein M [Gammaproteobacteria bacterium]|nr:type II secretion system protein M [Gammaproteobacteria bacterium]
MNKIQSNIKKWWHTLAAREQKIVTTGGTIAIILIIYTLIWQPFSSAVNNAKKDVINKRNLVTWMQHATARITALRANGNMRQNISNTSLLTFVDNSLRSNNLNRYVTQIKQADNSKVALNFNSAPFDELISWLTKIWQQDGINTTNATFQKTDNQGLVKVSLILSK